ncbi:replication protein, partial [Natranaerobius trueperi]
MLEKVIKTPKEHIEIHHQESDGWITLAKKQGSFTQYHYRPHEITEELLSEWLGEDVYFSQNTFYKPKRDIFNVRQLRALYVDVDCYLMNYDPKWVVGRIEQILVEDGEIPDPNLIIFSGRGIVVVWFIKPVPYKALPLWQTAQEYFLDKLKDVGGDTKATDASRIFRLAGTTNSNSGEKVTVQYRHDYRYDLKTDIRDKYLPNL